MCASARDRVHRVVFLFFLFSFLIVLHGPHCSRCRPRRRENDAEHPAGSKPREPRTSGDAAATPRTEGLSLQHCHKLWRPHGFRVGMRIFYTAHKCAAAVFLNTINIEYYAHCSYIPWTIYYFSFSESSITIQRVLASFNA